MRRPMKFPLAETALLALLCLTPACRAADAGHAPIYADLRGEVVLDNPRVLVERFVLEPGRSTGRHSHPADQLLVFVRGGVLKSLATGRSTLWQDGRVLWQEATDRADEGSTNAGAAPIEMIWVTLKRAEPAAAPAPPEGGADAYGGYLNYPNIPGEDLLENRRVIVQRFNVRPGQWEGVHAHHPNMLYIHIRGGQWASRSNKEREHAYPNSSPDGEVGWMPTVDLSEGHE